MKIAVLASGSGTILNAMVTQGIEVSSVLVDRPCGAEELALAHGIPLMRCYREDFTPAFDRMAYSYEVANELQNGGIELVAMAGYGTVLEQPVHEAYQGRILNTHPSLLPAFPGWHAVREALRYGVRVTGCTVHLATLAVDAGPILAQRAVEVRLGDTESTLHERIKEIERVLYPLTLRQYAEFLSHDGQGDFFEFQERWRAERGSGAELKGSGR
ncbi:MAG: phosphoribosylglycinamide formyltransferase [Actinomycetota bacterium]|nr:phosphoribosylglycinamide formyltransferase [Actinomycetota bacterium]